MLSSFELPLGVAVPLIDTEVEVCQVEFAESVNGESNVIVGSGVFKIIVLLVELVLPVVAAGVAVSPAASSTTIS